MALAVCLLLDDRADRAVRHLWDRLEARGVPTLRSHTHGRHVPHLSYAVLRRCDPDAVEKALEELPDGEPLDLRLEGLGTFRRGRAWLIPAVSADLLERQERVVAALAATGAELHWHYLPGTWVPHCSLAPRVPASSLPVVATAVNEVLPLPARATAAALVDTGTGRVQVLTHLV